MSEPGGVHIYNVLLGPHVESGVVRRIRADKVVTNGTSNVSFFLGNQQVAFFQHYNGWFCSDPVSAAEPEAQ